MKGEERKKKEKENHFETWRTKYHDNLVRCWRVLTSVMNSLPTESTTYTPYMHTYSIIITFVLFIAEIGGKHEEKRAKKPWTMIVSGRCVWCDYCYLFSSFDGNRH